MARRKRLGNGGKRISGRVPLKKVVYAICEGKTEREYVKALNRSAMFPNITLRVYPSAGQEPHPSLKNLISYAKRANKEHEDSLAFWIICDTDNNLMHKDRLNVLLKQHRKMHVSISHPCIEFWFLEHYTNQLGGCSDADHTLRKLREHDPNYKKGEISQSLIQKTLDAIETERINRKCSTTSDLELAKVEEPTWWPTFASSKLKEFVEWLSEDR